MVRTLYSTGFVPISMKIFVKMLCDIKNIQMLQIPKNYVMLFEIVKKQLVPLFLATISNCTKCLFHTLQKLVRKILHQKQVFIVFLIIGVTIINRTPTVTGSRAS